MVPGAPEVAELLTDMHDTLEHLRARTGLGRALAAPQIDALSMAVAVQLPDRSFSMLNPVIARRSPETFAVWDSCFCFDLAFFVEVERHRRIEVRYTTPDGDQVTEELAGDFSELVQHEIDHLHGILAVDRIIGRDRIMMRAEYERRVGPQITRAPPGAEGAHRE